MPMPEPVFDTPNYDDWDEHDRERFLQRSDVRSAKFQELFETLLDHPDRDRLIAHDMGWTHTFKACGCDDKDCAECGQRFDCEAYEMLRMAADPEEIEDDPDAEDLIACFDQVLEIPAYCAADAFASRIEEALREHAPQWAADDDLLQAIFSAQMVPARIAGGHGIGYERDSLCGNIANCKRAHRNLSDCMNHLRELETRNILPAVEMQGLRKEAEKVSVALQRWIESLRAKVWWR